MRQAFLPADEEDVDSLANISGGNVWMMIQYLIIQFIHKKEEYIDTSLNFRIQECETFLQT